ncbi:MAG: ATP-dependent zinc metalloprotease FtsH [Oscillospiraceae bacterium]|nr:ATP-dependent zinc metalloprotease FtsH [Oscillospiraceae bacterium]
MKSSTIRLILFYLVLIVVIIFIAGYFLDQVKPPKVTYGEILEYFYNDEVESCIIDENNEMKLTLADDAKTVVTFKLRDLALFETDIGQLARDNLNNADKHLKEYDILRAPDIAWWVSFIPYLIVIVVIVVIWVVFMNQATGRTGKITSFGKAKAKLGSEEKKKVYFADLAGMDEEKEELREVVDYLRNPLKFVELGARIPRGVLLVGPPGTGKTYLAKAVAGEAGVPFYSTSGSDFVEMYVGVGASRVRDLFETAKKSPASILFIDEIDAVGRHRGAGLGGGHDEREQTLNQLLVEMDGFGTNEGVIVIAATNRPDILDPALLRPGRFDRQITVNYPDVRGREEVLKIHAKNKPFEESVKFDVIAKSTAGFTPADLENLLNEAALLAARKMKKLIGMNDIEEAMLKVMMGPQKKTKVISDHEKKLVAYHEAGHAIVTRFVATSDPVHQISIIPTGGGAGGYTMSLPKEDKNIMSKSEMEERIVILLGGRVAEKLIMHDISTGASNDIQRVSTMARRMITQYGMSEKLGPIVFGTGHEEVFLGRELNSSRNYSEKVAAEIDEEVKVVVDGAYDSALRILEEHKDKLHYIAEFLLKYEVMDGDQFEAAITGEPTFDELDAMVVEKRRKSDEENRKVREETERRAKEEAEKRELLRRKEQEELLNRARNRSQSGQNNSGDKNDKDGDIKFKDGDDL